MQPKPKGVDCSRILSKKLVCGTPQQQQVFREIFNSYNRDPNIVPMIIYVHALADDKQELQTTTELSKTLFKLAHAIIPLKMG